MVNIKKVKKIRGMERVTGVAPITSEWNSEGLLLTTRINLTIIRLVYHMAYQ